MLPGFAGDSKSKLSYGMQGPFAVPVEANLIISTGKVEADALVQVYDALGTLMLSQRINSTATTLPANAWKAGMYWVRVVNGKKITIPKIVKL